jgi:hypothetical protein
MLITNYTIELELQCVMMQSEIKDWVFRAYPNNPLYSGRLQSPMPALSVKKYSQPR